MVASVVYGEWRWQLYQNLLNSVFIPYMSASVIECRSIGSCSSSGLCAGLMITGTDPGIPPHEYSATPRTGIRTHTGASDTVWQPILNQYNIW